jgi:hypothetical protein
MLERRLDVEGHDVRRVEPPEAVEVLALDSFDELVNVPADLGFVHLVLCGHRYPTRPFPVEAWLLPNSTL